MRSYSPAQIERWRDRVHRRLKNRRISTRHDAARFLEEVGFCFVFDAGDVVLPSLGGAVDLGSTSKAAAAPRPSQWLVKEFLPDERDAFMGRILLRRPTLVSLRLLPFFMALQMNARRDPGTPSGRRQTGPAAHLILESLRKKSPQSTKELLERAMRGAAIGKSSFDLTLRQLQADFSVSSVIERSGSHSASWALARRTFSKQIRKSHGISPEEARRAILEQHFRNQLVLTVTDIRHLFRWSRQEIFQTLGELIRRGIVTPEVQVDGIAGRTYCLLT
jgi:hypothetical protein